MRKPFQFWTGTMAVTAGALVLAGVLNAQVGTEQTQQNPVDRPNQYDAHQQSATQQHSRTSMDHAKSHREACRASEIIGLNVRGKSGDDSIGEINDLMISHDGKVEYVAVSFGGFLGMGDKLFAVPLDAIDFEKTGDRDSDDAYARIDVTEQTLNNKKGFNQDKWPEKADDSFVTSTSRRQAERALQPGEHTSQQ